MSTLIDHIPNQFRQRGYAKPYSRWHYENLPDWCWMMDLDSIEWRPGRGIVAIIETRATDTFLNKFQNDIIVDVGMALKVPIYFVRHNQDLTEFKITNLGTDEEKIMDAEEYKNFLKYL